MTPFRRRLQTRGHPAPSRLTPCCPWPLHQFGRETHARRRCEAARAPAFGGPLYPQKSRAQSLVGNRPGAEYVPGDGLNFAPIGFLRLQT